jgi:hypothetical protein
MSRGLLALLFGVTGAIALAATSDEHAKQDYRVLFIHEGWDEPRTDRIEVFVSIDAMLNSLEDYERFVCRLLREIAPQKFDESISRTRVCEYPTFRIRIFHDSNSYLPYTGEGDPRGEAGRFLGGYRYDHGKGVFFFPGPREVERLHSDFCTQTRMSR